MVMIDKDISREKIQMPEKWAKKGLYFLITDEFDDPDFLSDGKIPLTLWREKCCLAIASVSRGLAKYFIQIYTPADLEIYAREGIVTEESSRIYINSWKIESKSVR